MKRTPASVQASHLRVSGIGDAWVILEHGACCAALEVDGLPFTLLSDDEQANTVTGYAAFLQGLEQPLQLLVRLLPADMDRYLQELEHQARRLPPGLAPVARSHVAFLRDLARRRLLLERHHYLVITSTPGHATTAPLLQRWRRQERPTTAQPGGELPARLDALIAGLRRCNLNARRLGGAELAALLYSCWRPEGARRQRLAAELQEALPSLLVAGPHERNHP